MSKTAFRIIGGVKYVYLIVFFTLLSGLFYPIINNTSFDNTVLGVFTLLVGLVGGLSLYKAATSENNKTIFMGIGFGLMAISLYSIFYLTGLRDPILTAFIFIASYVGLVGGLSLYKAATSENNKTIFMGIGFGLMAISLYSIFYLLYILCGFYNNWFCVIFEW